MLFKKQAVHDAWAATDRTLDFKIAIKDKTYTATDITNLTFDSGAMNGAALTIGSTYQNTIKITFSHLIEGLELLDEVTPQIGIRLSDGTWDFTNLGVFVLDSEVVQDRNNNTTTLSASDRMCMLGGTYESKLTYPAPISNIAIEVANLSGVKINEADFARIPNTEINSFGSVTYRDAIGYIAQFAGGFATFDRDGLLDVRTLSDPNFMISPEQYQSKGLSKNESFYRIGGITCTVTTIVKDESGNETQETKMLQAGSSSGTQITLINPSMTQVLLDELYQQLQDINFYPFALNWFGDPSLEVGDWITIKDMIGNEFKTPNLLYSLTFGGGLSAVSKADTTVTSSASFVYKGQLSQDVENIRQHMNASGNIVSEGIDPPSNPKPGDIWFAKDGPDTIIKTWVIDPETGIGSWQEQVSTKPDEKLQESVDNAVKDAADALDKSNTAVENSNKAVENAGFANSTANDAKASATEATGKAAEAVSKAEGAQVNADTAVKNSNDALTDAANAVKTANDSSTKATQAQQDANNATAKAEDAISAANKAQGDATNAINNAQNALDKYNNLKSGNRNYLLNTATPFEADWNNTTTGNQLFFIWNYSGGSLKDNGFKPGELALLEYDWEISNATTYSEFAVYFESTPLTIVSSNGTKGNATTTVAPSESLTSGHVTVLVKWKDAVETNTQTKIKAYCVPGFAAHIKISNAILAKRNVPGDWSPAPEDVETEITNINGELSQKVSQTEYNNLKGTVESNSTQITQNQHDIQLKANQTQVDTINKTVQNQQTEINQNANQIELKADQSQVDTINKTVQQNTANIGVNANAIKLKADSSTVDNLAGRVTKTEGELTVQADKIAQTVSKTELDNTLGKYATQTWTQGQIKTAADEIELSVQEVQSNVDGMQIGGRNYLLKTAEAWDKDYDTTAGTDAFDFLWNYSGGALKNNGFRANDIATISFDWQTTNVSTYNSVGFGIYVESSPYTLVSSTGTNGSRTTDVLPTPTLNSGHASVTVKWKDTVETNGQTRIKIYVRSGFKGHLHIEHAKLDIGNKPTDWTAAPEDAQSQIDSLNQVTKEQGTSIKLNSDQIALKADQTVVDNLDKTVKQQGTSITQNADAIKLKADSSTVDTLNSTVTKQGTLIDQNAKSIKLKADSSTVNTIKGTVDSNSAAIKLNANSIALKADKTTVDNLTDTVTSQGASIKLNSDSIKLKADQTVVDNINKTVSSNTAAINVNTNNIKLKANQSTVDTLAGRVSTAEGKIEVQAGQIAQTVSKTELNSTLSGYATQTWTQGQIKTTADNINLSVQKVQSDLDNLEIGGQNYIRNGNFADLSGKYWRDWNGATGATRAINKAGDDWPANTPGLIKLVNPNGGQWGYAQDNIKIDANATYVVSALFQGDAGTKVALQHGNGDTDKWESKDFVLPGGKVRLSYTFTTGAATTTNIYVGFSSNGKGTAWVSQIKLERGNKATDWTPSPEDIASATDFANLEIKVNGIQGTVANKADQSQVTQLADQITSVVTGATAPNLIYNSEYENNADGWSLPSGTGYITNDPSSTYQGSLGLAINKGGTGWIAFAYSKRYELPNKSSTNTNNVYSASAMIKIYGGATATSIGISLGYYDAVSGGKRILWKDAVIKDVSSSNQNKWIEVKSEGLQVPDGAAAVEVSYWVNYGSTETFAHAVIAHPMLVKGQTAGIYSKDIASQSQITQMKDDINLRVQKGDVINQINISPESILIAGQKVHITGQTTIDNAVIKDAMIANLSASKLTAGTIDAGKINVVNLNASNITTGTITGANLSINLNTGEILFTKGAIKSTNGKLNINVDNGTFSATDSQKRGILFENGELHLINPVLSAQNPDYGSITANGLAFLGQTNVNWNMQIFGKDGLCIGTSDSFVFAENAIGSGAQFVSSQAQIFSQGIMRILGGANQRPYLSQSSKIEVGREAHYIGAGNDWTTNGDDRSVGGAIILDADEILINGNGDAVENGNNYVAFAEDKRSGYILSMRVYNRTYSSGSNMTVTANGVFGRISSASKYKLDISTVSNITEQAHAFLAVEPKQWFDKSETEDMAKELTEGDSGSVDSANVRPYYGYVAEDLYSAGLDNVVLRDSNTGELEGIQYDRLTIYHHELIRELYQRVNDLEAKIYSMEANK